MGATKREGGMCSFIPPKKGGGGGGKSFNHGEGGHDKFWSSFYMVARNFSHIEGGGGWWCKKFPLFKKKRGGGGGRKKFYTVLRGGGGAKSFGPAIFPFCSPPPSQ